MSVLANEPFGTVDSMEQLFAIAAEMERAAVDGYSGLAERMRRENRLDLAEVFDGLVAEKETHLAAIGRWSDAITGKTPDRSALGWDPGASFDDEGAGAIAPELLSAYRAFAMAVRNEERAFAFWSYLAADASSDELRTVCEQMAREELTHMAALRRERRRAFHEQRSTATGGGHWTLSALEDRLGGLLDAAGEAAAQKEAALFGAFSHQARERAAALAGAPLGDTPLLNHVQPNVIERLRSLVELLLDCYLDLGERLPSDAGRERAQTYAAQLLDCVARTRPSVTAEDATGP